MDITHHQNNNGQNALSTKQCAGLPDKAGLVRDLVAQSFAIFNTYGREPETLVHLLPAFWEVLQDRSAEDIQTAFKAWLRQKSSMPTPADILQMMPPRKWEWVVQEPQTGGVHTVTFDGKFHVKRYL